MNDNIKTALSIVVVLVIAGAFWLLLLGPKRDEASKLSERATSLQGEVSAEQQAAATALASKKNFSKYYERLLLTGEAVPAEAATPSLLVQLDGVSAAARTSFESISASGSDSAEASAEGGAESLLPLNSTVGPAGFSAMPYSLAFQGSFFNVADFIEGIDSLVETKRGEVDAKGRLITIDGFNLAPNERAEEAGSSGGLSASFDVTTYVTPPGQGLTAGASPAGPAETTPNLP